MAPKRTTKTKWWLGGPGLGWLNSMAAHSSLKKKIHFINESHPVPSAVLSDGIP